MVKRILKHGAKVDVTPVNATEKRIIIASHNEDVAFACQTFAISAGYLAVPAYSVEQVIENLVPEQTTVIMDVNLGNPGGYDFSAMQRLRTYLQEQTGLNVSVIPFSGNEFVLREAKKAGIEGVLKEDLYETLKKRVA